MRLFKRKGSRVRQKQINWLTIRCDNCSEENQPYVMYVYRSEIQIRPCGYKGRFQYYIVCTKCGKEIIIPEENISKEIRNYLIEKAYEA